MEHLPDPLADRPPPDRFIDALTETAAEYLGRRCIYRLAFAGMDIPALPREFQIGRIEVVRGSGPLITQRTTVVQRPGDELVFEKRLDAFVEVARDIPVTLLQIESQVPEDLGGAFDAWYSEACGAAGALAALLDERLTQRPVLEDLLVYAEDGTTLVGASDARMRLRHYLSYPVSGPDMGAIEEVGRVYTGSTGTAAACRWYLRAAQAGPVADSIVYLWIAIDGLLETEGSRVVPVLRTRLSVLKIDERQLPISLGRLYGLRGDVVHKGMESPASLREGFYLLEALVRLLLRSAMGVDTDWPFQVGQPFSPTKDMAKLEGAWMKPRYELTSDPDAG